MSIHPDELLEDVAALHAQLLRGQVRAEVLAQRRGSLLALVAAVGPGLAHAEDHALELVVPDLRAPVQVELCGLLLHAEERGVRAAIAEAYGPTTHPPARPPLASTFLSCHKYVRFLSAVARRAVASKLRCGGLDRSAMPDSSDLWRDVQSAVSLHIS
jgi:hypothetical protein